MITDKGLIGGSTQLLLLTLLNEKDCYGYEIIRELNTRSENVFQFKEGTLYPVLHKMEADGFLESYKETAENGKKRTYYKITVKGQKQLTAEAEKWEEFSTGVNKVIYGTSYAF